MFIFRRPYLALALALAALQAAAAGAAHAAGTQAGTVIQSSAQASYEINGTFLTTASNTVSVRVEEVLGSAIATLDAGPAATSGGEAVLAFELTNIGNGPEAFNLSAEPSQDGSAAAMSVKAIAIDANGNGVYDEGTDTVLAQGAPTPLINPDEAIVILVVVTVPDAPAAGWEGELELRAEAATGIGAPGAIFAGAGTSGGDAIVGASGALAIAIGTVSAQEAAIQLTKAAQITDPYGGTSPIPGATITYTINVSANGSGLVDNLVIADPIPAGTTYVPGTLTLDAATLTDLVGDDAGEADATSIMVALGNVSAGAAHTISFNVLIDQ